MFHLLFLLLGKSLLVKSEGMINRAGLIKINKYNFQLIIDPIQDFVDANQKAFCQDFWTVMYLEVGLILAKSPQVTSIQLLSCGV